MASDGFLSSKYLDRIREPPHAEFAGLNSSECHGVCLGLYRIAQINKEMLDRMRNYKNRGREGQAGQFRSSLTRTRYLVSITLDQKQWNHHAQQAAFSAISGGGFWTKRLPCRFYQIR